MEGRGIWYPLYNERARRSTPARAWAGAADLNMAASPRKNAFIDRDTTSSKTKKVLMVKRDINTGSERAQT